MAQSPVNFRYNSRSSTLVKMSTLTITNDFVVKRIECRVEPCVGYRLSDDSY